MTTLEFDDYGTELDFLDFAEWLEQVQEQEDGRGENAPWWFAPVDLGVDCCSYIEGRF